MISRLIIIIINVFENQYIYIRFCIVHTSTYYVYKKNNNNNSLIKVKKKFFLIKSILFEDEANFEHVIWLGLLVRHYGLMEELILLFGFYW